MREFVGVCNRTVTAELCCSYLPLLRQLMSCHGSFVCWHVLFCRFYVLVVSCVTGECVHVSFVSAHPLCCFFAGYPRGSIQDTEKADLHNAGDIHGITVRFSVLNLLRRALLYPNAVYICFCGQKIQLHTHACTHSFVCISGSCAFTCNLYPEVTL